MYSKFGIPYQVKDAAGNILWLGAASVVAVYECINSEASAAFAAGEAARADVATSIIPRWDYAASGSDLPITDPFVRVLRVSATSNVG